MYSLVSTCRINNLTSILYVINLLSQVIHSCSLIFKVGFSLALVKFKPSYTNKKWLLCLTITQALFSGFLTRGHPLLYPRFVKMPTGRMRLSEIESGHRYGTRVLELDCADVESRGLYGKWEENKMSQDTVQERMRNRRTSNENTHRKRGRGEGEKEWKRENNVGVGKGSENLP